MARLRTVVAVSLIVVGVGIMVNPTFGFSSLAADRGVNVATADDIDAYVGLEPVDESITGPGDEATVARIHNNLGAEVTLETTVDTRETLTTTADGDFAETIPIDGTTELTLECESGGLGSGEADVKITVDKVEAQSLGVQIEQATMTAPLEYDCGGPNRGNLEVQSTSFGENNGVLVFEVANTGNEDAQIQRASIDSTSSTAVEVTNGQSPEVSIDGDSVVNQRGGSGGMPIDGSVHHDGGPSTIEAGDTANVRIGTFVDENGGQVDMHGKTVSFSLYGSGGNPQYSLEGTGPVRVSDSDDVDTGGSVVVENDGTVEGDINAGGDVSTNDRTTIDGNVDSGGSVQTGHDGEIGGSVTADSDVSIGDRNSIGGSITSAGTVTVGHDTSVGGNINAGGDIVIRDRATINGDIHADGDVTIGHGVETEGTVTAGGTITDHRN